MVDDEAFDVVIVGGGAAGCVGAARLSESGSRSVLLVEAGPDLRANCPTSSGTAGGSPGSLTGAMRPSRMLAASSRI
jgi:choline dehydrogenase-like flavoprotein